jgi:hypothetical protein
MWWITFVEIMADNWSEPRRVADAHFWRGIACVIRDNKFAGASHNAVRANSSRFSARAGIFQAAKENTALNKGHHQREPTA